MAHYSVSHTYTNPCTDYNTGPHKHTHTHTFVAEDTHFNAPVFLAEKKKAI